MLSNEVSTKEALVKEALLQNEKKYISDLRRGSIKNINFYIRDDNLHIINFKNYMSNVLIVNLHLKRQQVAVVRAT